MKAWRALCWLTFVLLSLPCGAAAITVPRWDEFDADGGRYARFPDCARPPPASSCADSGNRDICSLIDHSEEITDSRDRRAFLGALLHVYRNRGLGDAASRASQALAKLGGEDSGPPQTEPEARLQLALRQAASCRIAEALDIVWRVDAGIPAVPALGSRLTLRARIAFILARIGLKVEARQRFLDTRRELDQVEERQPARLFRWDRDIRRALAMSAAELGDFRDAMDVAPEADNLPLLGEIAQAAVNHGSVDDAIWLARYTPAEHGERWTPLSWARMAIAQSLVEKGRAEEARSLVEDWGGSTYIDIDRMIALQMARTDAKAARALLEKKEPESCHRSIALVAARNGQPEMAQRELTALLNKDGSIDPETAHMVRGVAVSIDEDKAIALLDQTWQSMAKAPFKSYESFADLARAYGEIGLAERGRALLESVWDRPDLPATMPAKDAALHALRQDIVAILTARGMVTEAMKIAEGDKANRSIWYQIIAHELLWKRVSVPPYIDPDFADCAVGVLIRS